MNRLVFLLLSILNAKAIFHGLAKYEIEITIAADNQWELYIGDEVIKGPLDGENGYTYAWQNVKTIKREVIGNKVIAIKAVDKGVIAAIWAAVKINNQLYSVTGENGTKWRMTSTQPNAKEWLDIDYNTKGWKSAVSSDSCVSEYAKSAWSQLYLNHPNFFALGTSPAWPGGCDNINSNAWFRIFVNPKPEHTIGITLTADNHWKMYIKNKIINGPQDGENGYTYAWQNVQTIHEKLYNSEPFVIGIEAVDKGGLAAFVASVAVNEKDFFVTGIQNTSWTMTNEKPKNNDWLNPNFSTGNGKISQFF